MTPHPEWRPVRGVTLVEMMVGMVIGLLAVLVIAQVALVYEGQKRNTTSGADAQVNGALAMQTLQREIQLSGFGITSGGGAGCELRGKRGTVVPPWNGQPMVPVRIVSTPNAALGSPVTLVVMGSNQRGSTLPIRVTVTHKRDDARFTVDARTNLGNATGDLMVVVPPLPAAGAAFSTWCSVFNISATPSADGIPHAVDATTGAWNHDGTDPIFPGATSGADAYFGSAVDSASQLINLGTLTYREYSLVGGASGASLQLRSANATTAAWDAAETLFPQVVNLQAVYGIDTLTTAAPYRNADTWTATSPTTPDGWNRVIAVRVALVTRSSQYEKTEVTAAEPTWLPDGATITPLKVDHLTDWKHYRYRVYEAVVPLRNMLWQS
ncbi:MAG: PilW family protein [Leptothrix sp. (in: b-proteobacteria)]